MKEKQPKCIHHWIIDDNNMGICRKCEEIRKFPTCSEIRIFNKNVYKEERILA